MEKSLKKKKKTELKAKKKERERESEKEKERKQEKFCLLGCFFCHFIHAPYKHIHFTSIQFLV